MVAKVFILALLWLTWFVLCGVVCILQSHFFKISKLRFVGFNLKTFFSRNKKKTKQKLSNLQKLEIAETQKLQKFLARCLTTLKVSHQTCKFVAEKFYDWNFCFLRNAWLKQLPALYSQTPSKFLFHSAYFLSPLKKVRERTYSLLFVFDHFMRWPSRSKF